MQMTSFSATFKEVTSAFCTKQEHDFLNKKEGGSLPLTNDILLIYINL